MERVLPYQPILALRTADKLAVMITDFRRVILAAATMALVPCAHTRTISWSVCGHMPQTAIYALQASSLCRFRCPLIEFPTHPPLSSLRGCPQCAMMCPPQSDKHTLLSFIHTAYPPYDNNVYRFLPAYHIMAHCEHPPRPARLRPENHPR